MWLTLAGSYGSKRRGLDRRLRTGFVVILVLSGWRRWRGNSRTFWVPAVVAYGFFVVILVVSGSSTSSMFIFHGNSRTFVVRCDVSDV